MRYHPGMLEFDRGFKATSASLDLAQIYRLAWVDTARQSVGLYVKNGRLVKAGEDLTSDVGNGEVVIIETGARLVFTPTKGSENE